MVGKFSTKILISLYMMALPVGRKIKGRRGRSREESKEKWCNRPSRGIQTFMVSFHIKAETDFFPRDNNVPLLLILSLDAHIIFNFHVNTFPQIHHVNLH